MAAYTATVDEVFHIAVISVDPTDAQGPGLWPGVAWARWPG
jgi:hypothetical protein